MKTRDVKISNFPKSYSLVVDEGGLGRSYQFEQLSADRIEESIELEQGAFSNPWSRQLLLRELGKNNPLNIGISKRGRLIGQSFCMLLIDELHILNLSISREHREQGLARELLSRILDKALEMGARSAILEVRDSNKVAQSLYKSFGFDFLTRRSSYYRDNGEDALVLSRELKSSISSDLQPPKGAVLTRAESSLS